jgi:hypothetical protein
MAANTTPSISNTTFKLFADKMGGTKANIYIGTPGEIFYDITGNTSIRLSDGVTPGGILFATSSIKESFDPQFTTANNETLTGTLVTGSFVKQGHIVHLRVNVDFANTTFFGANNVYQFTLPFPTTSTITLRGGSLHQTNSSSIYHIAGITDIAISNNIMKLYYSGSTTDLGWKANTPVAATSNTSHFDLSGAYEISSEYVS